LERKGLRFQGKRDGERRGEKGRESSSRWRCVSLFFFPPMCSPFSRWLVEREDWFGKDG